MVTEAGGRSRGRGRNRGGLETQERKEEGRRYPRSMTLGLRKAFIYVDMIRRVGQ